MFEVSIFVALARGVSSGLC